MAGNGTAKGGYTAPVKLSEELADIVGGDEMPRHEVIQVPDFILLIHVLGWHGGNGWPDYSFTSVLSAVDVK